MRLPSPDDILRSLPEDHGLKPPQITAILRRAPGVIEAMTGTHVYRRHLHQEMLLRDLPEPLTHFPVEDVRAEGRPLNHTEKTGVVYPEVETSNYTVTYYVGYKPEEVPAIITKAVAHLTRHRLLGLEEDREETKAAIEILRQTRAARLAEREREIGQAVRKGAG